MARRLDYSALNPFQRQCISSTQEMNAENESAPDTTAIAQLVARRWQEERRYPALPAKNGGAGLHASWLRHCEYGDLMLHRALQTTRDV